METDYKKRCCMFPLSRTLGGRIYACTYRKKHASGRLRTVLRALNGIPSDLRGKPVNSRPRNAIDSLSRQYSDYLASDAAVLIREFYSQVSEDPVL